MANITNYEKQWCEENSITIDDYKNKYSREQKEEIKNQMKHRVEQERAAAKEAKEAEKIRLKEEKEAEKIRLKEEKEATRLQEKEAVRAARIEALPEWARGFTFDEKGNVKHSTANYMYYFDNHPAFKGKLRYDEYKDLYIYNNMPISDKIYRAVQPMIEEYIDEWKQSRTIDSMKAVADQYTYNSATDMLDQLKWDGISRVETLFIDLLGVEDTDLNRHITKTWLVGAVQRLYKPGCPNESVLILTGAQGAGKTLTLKWLAGEFGFDDAINISSNEKEYGMKLQNCWICCFDELSGLSKKEAAEYKNWFSTTTDNFRKPYGREVDINYRHNAYCATTNDSTFLKDYSDNSERRMWVLECHGTQVDGYKNAQKRTANLWRQIMAEAVYIYKENPDFIPYLGTEYIQTLAEHQKKYKDYNSDNVGDMLKEILDRPYILASNGDIVNCDDIIQQIKRGNTDYRALCPGEKKGYINHISHACVKRIMKEVLGVYQKHQYMRAALDGEWCVKMNKCRINGKLDRYYVRGSWENDKVELVKPVYRQYEGCTTSDIMPENDDINRILQLK